MRSLSRFVMWRLTRDTSPGAPQNILRQVECTTCVETSEVVDLHSGVAEDWALAHSGKNPSHTGYRATSTSFWRTTPVDGTMGAVEPPPVGKGRTDGS